MSFTVFILLLVFLFAVFRFDIYRNKGVEYSVEQVSDTSFIVIFSGIYGDSLYIGSPARFEYECLLNGEVVAENKKDYVFNFTVKGAMPVSLTLRNIGHEINEGDSLLFITASKHEKKDFEAKVRFFTENTLKHSEIPLFFTSKLPIIVISTDTFLNDNIKHTGTFHFFAGNGTENNILTDNPAVESRILIKVRGETSRSFPKKQYAVYFLKKNGNKKKVTLGELPQDHEFVLNGPFIDVSEMRNAFTYALYNKMGHWAPHTMFVELILNNDYRGLYVLTEKIKRTKVALPKCDSVCASAFMVKIDKPKEGWWERGCFRMKNNEYVTEKNDRDLHYYFMTVCPKYDNGKPCVGKIASVFDTVSKLIAAKNFDGVTTLLDYKTMIDFSILNELSKNVDAYRISTFFYKLPESKLRAGPPWDYNFSYGIIDIEGGLEPEGFMFDNTITLFWWRYLFHYDKDFAAMYIKRWNELRQNVLSDSQLIVDINNIYAKIKNAAVRDYEKWNHKDFNKSVENLKEWLLKRTEWIDKATEKQ